MNLFRNKQILRGNSYNALRLLAGVVTVVFIFMYDKLPPKRLTLLPSETTYDGVYGPNLSTGEPSAVWVNESEGTWRCINVPNYSYSCGYSLSLDANLIDGIDFTQYEYIVLKVNHVGDAKHLRFSMRNYNTAYSTDNKVESSKFMSVVIRASDFDTEAIVYLEELSVAEWWIRDFDIPRKYSAPEFDNIITLGMDYISAGDNTATIERIELVGHWITKEKYYLTVLAFWLMIIFWEGFSKFLRLYRQSSSEQRLVRSLVQDYQKLEEQKLEYETKSKTDILTGVLNRAGIENMIDTIFKNEAQKQQLGLLLLDIDHFKRINDTRGHDAGDRILVEVAKIVSSKTRDTDLFGRWGGEEFILLCPMTKGEQLQEIAEKLRTNINSHIFEPQKPLHVTASFGAACVKPDETFDDVFKRLDEALYQAKNAGRNAIVFSSC